jgi:serine/threonine-protein kinase
MADEPAVKLEPRQRIGKYEILSFIANGGMGTVYKARDTDLDRSVALKILTPALAKQPIMIDRFRREARTAARLQHENIVPIYEFGEHAGHYFLALEYVPGTDLQAYIDKKQQLAPEDARQIIIQAARALGHAHEQGIIHRDIKPSNFLLTKKDGKLLVKLTDLGLAMRTDREEDFRLTRPGLTVGTVDYMAPEQARDSAKADVRSDIYSLGCTLYHLLTGTAPFARGSLTERLLQHLEAEPLDVRAVNQNVPAGLVAVVTRMLAKRPEERYQTPQELLDDLEDPDVMRLKRPVPARKPAAPQPAPTKAAEPRPVETKPAEAKRPRKDSKANVATPPEKPRPRFRDDGGTPPRARPRRSALPWWILPVVGVGLLLLVVIAIGLSPSPPPPEPPPGPPKPPVAVAPEVQGTTETPVPVKPIPPEPAEKDPRLYRPTMPLDLPAVRQEMLGPFAAAPAAGPAPTVYRVSRTLRPDATSFRTLADALAQVRGEGPTVIEIHDNGPLFLDALPALTGRDVTLRAGVGYRPLLAWEQTATAPTLLAITRGRLTLDGLDFALRCVMPQADQPTTVFGVRLGQFEARGCTFALAGTQPRGVHLVQVQGAAERPAVPTDVPALRVRLTRCFARGSDLTLLGLHGTPADVLFEDMLAAVGPHPLLDVAGRADDPLTVRVVRSTLAAGQTLLQWRDLDGQPAAPTVQAFVWDSILSRTNPLAAEGDLVRLAGSTSPDHLRWKALNAVYAGWKNLLASEPVKLSGQELKAWHDRFRYHEGDLVLAASWPGSLPTRLDELPEHAFVAAGTPAGFAAQSGPGTIGCDIEVLPTEPTAWLERTFERRFRPLPELEAETPPPIEPDTDGLYHGERIELNAKVDLGQLLAARLQARRPAPRVVLHLAGVGEQATSPIRVANLAQLVLYFEPPREAGAAPLTLTVQPKAVGDRAALIEVEKGSLELIHARLRCENTRFAIVPTYLLRVQGGDVVLHQCHLQGPLGKAPDHFRALVAVHGAGTGSRRTFGLDARDSVLLSGKGIAHLSEPGLHLRARNCLLLALADAIRLDLADAPAGRPDAMILLDNNTIALRHALLDARLKLASVIEPVQVQARGNYFVDPFDAPSQSALLRCPPEALTHGWLAWQGKGNAFDGRLHAYLVLPGAAEARQTLADWQALWGRSGEPDALLVQPPGTSKTFSTDAPPLDRLVLPRDVHSVAGPPPGADLTRLGILKKKT